MRAADKHLKGRNVEEALKLFDQAASLKEKDPRPWREKGMVLGKMGRFKEAVNALDRALELNPDDAEAKEYRDAAHHKVELMKKATLVALGLKKVKKKERDEIRELITEQKARKKAGRLKQQGFALEKRARKYRSTDKVKARDIYFESASKFRKAASELMPEQQRQRGVEIEIFWAVFPASDGFLESFDYYIKMLKMARAWEQLGYVFQTKDKEVAGDMFMRAAGDKAHLAELRRKLKYTNEQILLYRSATCEKAEEMYKQAIGVDRMVELNDELEQKLKEAKEKKESAERAIAKFAKKK